VLDGSVGTWEMKSVLDDRWQLTRRAAHDVAHSREGRDDTAKNILRIPINDRVGCAAVAPLSRASAQLTPRRAVSHRGQYRTSKDFIQISPHRRMYPRLGLASEPPDATTCAAK
jgi:hypothetical protein